LIGSLLTNCLTVTGVEQFSDSARKIDSFGAIACDDAMARLDLFAHELGNDPEAFGYIVVYPQRGGQIVYGPPRKIPMVELWIQPALP
jgi:hypothetical protein